MTSATGAGECALCHRVVPADEFEAVLTPRGTKRCCRGCTSAADRIVEALAAPFLRAIEVRRRGGD